MYWINTFRVVVYRLLRISSSVRKKNMQCSVGICLILSTFSYIIPLKCRSGGEGARVYYTRNSNGEFDRKISCDTLGKSQRQDPLFCFLFGWRLRELYNACLGGKEPTFENTLALHVVILKLKIWHPVFRVTHTQSFLNDLTQMQICSLVYILYKE